MEYSKGTGTGSPFSIQLPGAFHCWDTFRKLQSEYGTLIARKGHIYLHIDTLRKSRGVSAANGCLPEKGCFADDHVMTVSNSKPLFTVLSAPVCGWMRVIESKLSCTFDN